MKLIRYIIFGIVFSFIHQAFAAGTLRVLSTPFEGIVPTNGINIPFLSLRLTAGGPDVSISQIDVRLTGLSSFDDIESVRATAGFKRSMKSSVQHDGIARLRFRRPLVIPEGITQEVIITANLDIQGGGRTIGFVLEHIETDSILSPPAGFSSSLRGIERDVSSYLVSEVTFAPLGGEQTLRHYSYRGRVGRFRLQNRGTKDVILQNLTLRNVGTADLEERFWSLTLYGKNNQPVSSMNTFTSKQVSFSFKNGNGNGYLLRRGDSEIFSIWGNVIAGHRGETVSFVLNEKSDLQMREAGNFYSRWGDAVRQSRYRGGQSQYSRLLKQRLSKRFSPSPQPRSSVRGKLRAGRAYRLRSSYSRSRNRALPQNLWNQNYSPGSKDVLFLDTYVSSKSPIWVDEIWVFVASQSAAADKNGNGIADEIDDFEETFGPFYLYVDGRREDFVSDFSGSGSDLSGYYLKFHGGLEMRGSTHLQVTGRIKRSAQPGDRLRLLIDKDRSFPEKEYVR